MRILDISVPLRTGMPHWPNSPGCTVTRVLDQLAGDEVTSSSIDLDVHCGTHLDAPLHYLRNGASVDDTDLGSCVGPAFVADLRGITEIGSGQLEARVPQGETRLLLKTDNSALWRKPHFVKNFAALTVDGAQWVADRGMRLVANDYLSIQLFNGDPRTHRVLMEAGVIILEGVDLSEAAPGTYDLICLPLRIADAEGAPARAVLLPRVEPTA
jgi:arylformamidase